MMKKSFAEWMFERRAAIFVAVFFDGLPLHSSGSAGQ